MSQSKTIIQGFEPDGSNKGGYGKGPEGGPSFYSRSSGGQQPARGTIVPGMSGQPEQPFSQGGVTNAAPQPRATANSGKPVVGFLYTISRTPVGEYWPLHIGPNTIGQDAACDIVLKEGTISSHHAQIVVRQIKNSGQIIAAITDTMSTNGTMINGETIGFTPTECKNGDVITIGNNYELIMILIETMKLGLKVAEHFIPVPADDDTYTDTSFSPGPRPFFPQRSPQDTQGGWGNSSQVHSTMTIDPTSTKKDGTVPL